MATVPLLNSYQFWGKEEAEEQAGGSRGMEGRSGPLQENGAGAFCIYCAQMTAPQVEEAMVPPSRGALLWGRLASLFVKSQVLIFL